MWARWPLALRRAVLPVDANGRFLLWVAILKPTSTGGPMWARWPLALWAAVLYAPCVPKGPT